jgi:hypothetical protein
VDILETLYEKPPSLLRFQERKVHIEHPNTLLLGPSGAGKTTLILDFLSTLKTASYLYIDANDLRLEGNLSELDLGSFYHQNNLELLVIDNYYDSIALPNGCNLLLSSCDLSLHVKGLKTLHVDYLDFEEFIAFGKGSVSPQHMFNLFANHGRHPGAVHLQDSLWIEYLQNQLRLYLKSPNALTLFKQMAHFQSKPLSLHRLYNELKKDMKISKDTLYEKALLFEQHGLIHFIPKWQAPKTPKKFYLSDFVIKNAITFEKDFLKRFENIVFCELVKNYDEIFYSQKLDFYLPQNSQGIVCIPFLPPELILRRFFGMPEHLKEFKITNLTVLTLGNEGEGKRDGIDCEIIPFWDWALRQ